MTIKWEVNELLAIAKEREASRERMAQYYDKLSNESLLLLIDECGGQKKAAEIISRFLGVKKSQGTLSKAVKKNDVKTHYALKVIIDQMTSSPNSAVAMGGLVSKFKIRPIYHDILKTSDGVCGLYVDCRMINKKTIVTLMVNGEERYYSLDDVRIP